MERSFNQDAFYSPYSNGFDPGIMAYSTYADRRGTWAVGVFKNSPTATPTTSAAAT